MAHHQAIYSRNDMLLHRDHKKKCTYIYTKKSKEWVAFEDTSELKTDANSIGKCHDLYLVGLIELYTIFEKNEMVNR